MGRSIPPACRSGEVDGQARCPALLCPSVITVIRAVAAARRGSYPDAAHPGHRRPRATVVATCPNIGPGDPDRPALEQDQQGRQPEGARERGAPLPQLETRQRPAVHPTGQTRRRPRADASAARATRAAGSVTRVQQRRGGRHQDQRGDRSDRDHEEDRCDDLWSGHSGPRRAYSGQAQHLWRPMPQPHAGEHAPQPIRRARGAGRARGEGAARSGITTPWEDATCGLLREARPRQVRRAGSTRRSTRRAASATFRASACPGIQPGGAEPAMGRTPQPRSGARTHRPSPPSSGSGVRYHSIRAINHLLTILNGLVSLDSYGHGVRVP